ncbi:MAG: hypothetical protein H6828_09950 [Planctomycetes bacterium]|nr:hypothetical protein [Planctomycetota bacterium]
MRTRRPNRRRGLRWSTGVAACLVGFSLGLHAQGLVETSPSSRALRPVQPEEDVAARWRARLTSQDLDAREAAFGELAIAAARDPRLVQALEEWAAGDASSELAWTARLALRELDHPATLPALLRLRLQPAALESDPLTPTSPFCQTPKLSLLSPRVVDLPHGTGRLRVIETYRLEIKPDAATLTVTSEGAQGADERVYASASLADLVAEHPDLARDVPGLEELATQPIAHGVYYQWKARSTAPVPGNGPRVLASSPLDALSRAETLPTDILGVKCVPVTTEIHGVLLGPGVGLRVERREPGTIADQLGLARGDILTELNGVPLCSADELSHLLSEAQGTGLQVKILDRSGLERTLTWLPSPGPAPQRRSE